MAKILVIGQGESKIVDARYRRFYIRRNYTVKPLPDLYCPIPPKQDWQYYDYTDQSEWLGWFEDSKEIIQAYKAPNGKVFSRKDFPDGPKAEVVTD